MFLLPNGLWMQISFEVKVKTWLFDKITFNGMFSAIRTERNLKKDLFNRIIFELQAFM
jgi:hypothetical protein